MGNDAWEFPALKVPDSPHGFRTGHVVNNTMPTPPLFYSFFSLVLIPSTE
jgi:hypothetical protein